MPIPASSSPANFPLLDSQLLPLKDYDTVFLVDDSQSMEWAVRNCKPGQPAPLAQSRWHYACQLSADFAELAARFDTDGVDVHFLNQTKLGRENLRTRAEITSLFTVARPGGATPLGTRLTQLMRPYLDQCRNCDENTVWPKARNYIVLTDGEPSDGEHEKLSRHLEDIVLLLKKPGCRKSQIGIQFVQVGDNEEATRFLQSLDDNDFGDHDFVDTIKPVQMKPRRGWMARLGIAKPLEEKPVDQRQETIKALLGGMSRYYDEN